MRNVGIWDCPIGHIGTMESKATIHLRILMVRMEADVDDGNHGLSTVLVIAKLGVLGSLNEI